MLLGDEVELGIDVAVNTLTSLSANGDDGSIGILRLVVDEDGADGNLGLFLLSEHLHLVPLCRMALGLELHLRIINILAVDVGQCGR